jgi:excisionase family DNA binding protein
MNEEPRVLPENRLWTVEDVAYYLGVPVQTVYCWRSAGRGPAGRRVGKRLRYRPVDVRAWVEGLSSEVAS